MAESKISPTIKSVTKTITTDSVGNATLFSNQIVTVIAVVDPTAVCTFSPFHGYGNTYVKACGSGSQTPTGVANATYTVTIYYY